MKRNKLVEAKTKNAASIGEDLIGLLDRLIKVKLDIKTGRLKNIKEAKKIKKDIAQLKTILREKRSNE